MSRNNSTYRILLLFLPIFVFNFSILRSNSAENVKIIFPHQPHLEESSCKDCHFTDRNSRQEPVIPVAANCASCHENSKFLEFRADFTRQNLIFQFSHKVHWKQSCIQCHKEMDLSYQTLSDEKNCRECHKKNLVNLTCSNCHGELKSPPSYHISS